MSQVTLAQPTATSTTPKSNPTCNYNQQDTIPETTNNTNNNLEEDNKGAMPDSVSSKLPNFTKLITTLLSSTLTNSIQTGGPRRLPRSFKCIGGTTVSLCDYLKILAKTAEVEEEHLVLTLFLIEKAVSRGLVVSENEAFKLIAVLLFLSFKLASDTEEFWSVENFSAISGLYPEKLREMEQFLVLGVFDFQVLP